MEETVLKTPTADAIYAQVARIRANGKQFQEAPRLGALLEWIVEKKIAGEDGDLKEIRIGVAVFGRPDFDPSKASVVRVTATRLRKALVHYYRSEGKHDPILIEMSKEGYHPIFTARPVTSRAQPEDALNSTRTESADRVSPTSWFRRRWLLLMLLLLMVVLPILTVISGLWLALPGSRSVTSTAPKELRQRRLFSQATTEGHTPFRIKTGQVSGQLLITPNGEKLYAIAPPSGKSVIVVGVKDRQVKGRIDLPLPLHRAFMSKSGKRVYITARTPYEGVMVLDTSTDRVVEVIPTTSPAFGVAATPDDKALYLAMGYAGLKRIDLQTRESRVLSELACPFSLDIDRLGRFLFVSYQCGGPGGSRGHDAVAVYDIAAEPERIVEIIQGKDLPMVGHGLTVAPQGRMVLLDGADACSSPAYDHGGCAIIGSHVLHLWDFANRRLVASVPPEIIGIPAFLPSGPRVVFADANLIVWDWARQVVAEKVNRAGLRFGGIAVTPSGDSTFVSIFEAADLLVFAAAHDDCGAPAHGLANLYSMDGTLDDAQGVSSLVFTSRPEFVAGRVGQALRFDGKDASVRVTAGGSYCAFCQSEWTESVLMKLSSTTDEMTILEHAPPAHARERRLYKAKDNHIVLEGGDGRDSNFVITSPGTVDVGRWYHLAVVTQDNRLFLYIDGTLQGQSVLKQPFPVGAGQTPVFLGASQGKRNFLNGLIDEVAVYNRALSAEEVKTIAGPCVTTR